MRQRTVTVQPDRDRANICLVAQFPCWPPRWSRQRRLHDRALPSLSASFSSTPVSGFLIHWLQVQVLNDPQQLKAQAPRFGLSAFVGCPAAAASAPVLWGVRCRGRLCGREAAERGSAPRGPRSAVSEGRCRVRCASRGRRLMGAPGCVGPAGVTLQLALAPSGVRLRGAGAGAQPRPPPSAGLATPQPVQSAKSGGERALQVAP